MSTPPTQPGPQYDANTGAYLPPSAPSEEPTSELPTYQEPVQPDYNAPSAYASYGQAGYPQPGQEPTYQTPQGGYQQSGYQPAGYQQQGGYIPQQPYSGYQPYGQPASPYPQKKPKLSPLVGIVSLAVVVVGSLIVAFPFGSIDLRLLFQWAEQAQANPNVVVPTQFASMLMSFSIGASMVFLGFIGSIIAMALNRGRIWGVVALIAAIILPWLLMMLFMMANPSLPR